MLTRPFPQGTPCIFSGYPGRIRETMRDVSTTGRRRIFAASPHVSAFVVSGTLVSKRNCFSQIYRFRHAFDRKKIVDRSFRLSSTLLRSRGLYIYIYIRLLLIGSIAIVETTLGISRSIPFGGGRCVKSAVSFARVVLRGAARMSGVGGRDPGAEVARKQERAGRAGGYCLLGDLSSNTSRQATRPGHQAWGQTRAFYPYPWGQPPAPVEIKNSLYYTSHSVLPRPPPPPPPPAKPSIRSSPFLLPRARSLSLSRHILPAAPAAPRSAPRTDLI